MLLLWGPLDTESEFRSRLVSSKRDALQPLFFQSHPSPGVASEGPIQREHHTKLWACLASKGPIGAGSPMEAMRLFSFLSLRISGQPHSFCRKMRKVRVGKPDRSRLESRLKRFPIFGLCSSPFTLLHLIFLIWKMG